MARVYWETLKMVRYSLLTIAAMLALGFVTKFSGVDATMGLTFAMTGMFYPFFGTLLDGWELRSPDRHVFQRAFRQLAADLG